MGWSREGTRWEYLMFLETNEVLKNNKTTSEGHKSHLEGVPNGPKWGSLSNKITIIMGYNPQTEVDTTSSRAVGE